MEEGGSAEAMDFSDKPASSTKLLRRWTSNLSFSRTVVTQRVKEERVSVMYQYLPGVVQSIVPPLPSLRRTVSLGGSNSSYGSPASSGSTTPVSDASASMVDVSATDIPDDSFALEKSSYPVAVSVLATPDGKFSGVSWKCGQQGVHLLESAYNESKSRLSPDYNPYLEREAYLNGVSWLLKGLPRDLDEQEIAALQRSVPSSVQESFPAIAYGEEDTAEVEVDREKNYVHNVVLCVLVYFMACARWAAPYILWLFSEMVRCEREYKVSEKALGTTMSGVTVGVGAIRRFGDGVAGQILVGIVDYTAEGLQGALKEFADGVSKANAKENANRKEAGKREKRKRA